MYNKFNWHQKKIKDKKHELKKRAPRWFVYGRKKTIKQLKHGEATISLTKINTSSDEYNEINTKDNSCPSRYKLTISTSWNPNIRICYYSHKPNYTFIGRYNTQEFISNIIPIIPNDVLPYNKKRALYKTAYHYITTNELTTKNKNIREKLYRERHWFSGMIKESNGRSALKMQINKAINAYNNVLKYDESLITSDKTELVKTFECDCDYCLEVFGKPVVIDEELTTSYNAISAIEQAEKIDLKQNYERWVYKY